MVIILFAIPEQKRLRYGIAIIFTGFVLGFGLMKIHPRMRNFDYHADQRINIWGAALQHPKDYIWDGLGAGQSGNYMMQQYEDLKMTTYAERRYNCHNQYLEETMEIGVFGLILFLMQTHKYVGDIGNWGIIVGIVGIALIFHNQIVGIAVLVLGCCLIISGAIAAPKVASASNNG